MTKKIAFTGKNPGKRKKKEIECWRKEQLKLNQSRFKNKVETPKFEYEEIVNEFTGLIFHCPNCEEVFHLHVANVRLKKK